MGFNTIPARNIENYSDRSKYMLIDVRSPDEYMEGHIPHALNVPYEEFDAYMPRLSRKLTYVLYCDRGATSLLLARKMFRAGYDVLSVIGGMNAYRGPQSTIRRTGRDH